MRPPVATRAHAWVLVAILSSGLIGTLGVNANENEGSGSNPESSERAPEDPPEGWPPPMMSGMQYGFLRAEQLEWRGNDGDADKGEARWDVMGWWGTDENRVWLKTEGERNTSGSSSGDAELQILYSRMVAPFWDAQIGVRQDFLFGSGPNHERTFLVLSADGLAPYWFEIEPSLFVSFAGDVSFRLMATYDLFVTQRIVAQPRFELNAAVQDVSKFGVQSGFNDIELGLRLRYEVRREIAPYVGINWIRKLGDTADLARDEGEQIALLGFVAGFRIQF